LSDTVSEILSQQNMEDI